MFDSQQFKFRGAALKKGTHTIKLDCRFTNKKSTTTIEHIDPATDLTPVAGLVFQTHQVSSVAELRSRSPGDFGLIPKPGFTFRGSLPPVPHSTPVFSFVLAGVESLIYARPLRVPVPAGTGHGHHHANLLRGPLLVLLAQPLEQPEALASLQDPARHGHCNRINAPLDARLAADRSPLNGNHGSQSTNSTRTTPADQTADLPVAPLTAPVAGVGMSTSSPSGSPLSPGLAKTGNHGSYFTLKLGTMVPSLKISHDTTRNCIRAQIGWIAHSSPLEPARNRRHAGFQTTASSRIDSHRLVNQRCLSLRTTTRYGAESTASQTPSHAESANTAKQSPNDRPAHARILSVMVHRGLSGSARTSVIQPPALT